MRKFLTSQVCDSYSQCMSYGDVQRHAKQAQSLAHEARIGFGHDQPELAALAGAVESLATAVAELGGQLHRDN